MSALPGRERPLTGAGLAVLAGALVWSLLAGRAAGGSLSVVVCIGLVLMVADVLVATWEARTGLGLAVPAGLRVPPPRWWWPMSLAGVLSVVAGVAASSVAAVVAGGLGLVAAAAGAADAGRRAGVSLDPRVVRAALAVQSFAASAGLRRGQRLAGLAMPLGARWSRLVVAAPDGRWGDVVVPAVAAGADPAALVAAVAGVDLVPAGRPGPELRLYTGPPAWREMVRGR